MILSGPKKPLILLTGKTGQIGSELEKQLAPYADLAAFDRTQFNIQKPDRARGIIRGLRPNVIINAAGYTAVDQAEVEPAEASATNAGAVRVLAEEAERVGALLIHYSTDYVFDGTKDSPYVESDFPNPLSVYGRTKLAGELAIQDSGCSYLIFRTTWIYAATGRNFVRTIAQLAQQRSELSIVNDQLGAPTSASDVAKATLQTLRKASLPVRELYHMTAGGETTWYGLAREIVKELERRNRRTATLKPITTAEYPTPARRLLNCVLSNAKIMRDFGVSLPNWNESLQVVLAELSA